MSQAVWRWRRERWLATTRVVRWLGSACFLVLWLVAVLQMIADYSRDPYNPLLRGSAAYGHNYDGALPRGIVLSLVALVGLYAVVRPWSFQPTSFWSAGRLLIALGLLVPWTGIWFVAGIHGGGVDRVHVQWLFGVDLLLLVALVGTVLVCVWRWVPRRAR